MSSLPIAPREHASASAALAAGASAERGYAERKTILLVEDNPADVRLTQRSLRENGIANELVVRADGASALEYLERECENANGNLPTLTLLDLNLPNVDGLEVLRRIRRHPRLRRLPVVILTSSKEETDLLESYDLGANSYIQKPVEFDEFNHAIRHLGLYWLLLNEPPPQ